MCVVLRKNQRSEKKGKKDENQVYPINSCVTEWQVVEWPSSWWVDDNWSNTWVKYSMSCDRFDESSSFSCDIHFRLSFLCWKESRRSFSYSDAILMNVQTERRMMMIEGFTFIEYFMWRHFNTSSPDVLMYTPLLPPLSSISSASLTSCACFLCDSSAF